MFIYFLWRLSFHPLPLPSIVHLCPGIGSGSAPLEQCIELAQRPGVLQHWTSCRHLIIDEISMVEAGFFDKLESVARWDSAQQQFSVNDWSSWRFICCRYSNYVCVCLLVCFHVKVHVFPMQSLPDMSFHLRFSFRRRCSSFQLDRFTYSRTIHDNYYWQGLHKLYK